MKDESQAIRELLDISDQVAQKKVSLDLCSRDYGIPLYPKELVTIKIIGRNPGINVTKVAERMSITRGAVSQTVAKLVRKKLIRKTYAEDNAKEVILQLTDLGWTVFNAREKTIKDFINMAQISLGSDFKPQVDMLISVMSTINKLLTKYISELK
jgi:DNA-binding MarR family transcriptional regulator